MRRGEVWRVRLPQTGSRAQAGERPAVIVQHGRHTAALATVLIVPFTSQLKAANFPGTLVIPPDSQNGLTVPSVALAFQLTALDKRNVLQHLGVLDPAMFSQVLAQIDLLIH